MLKNRTFDPKSEFYSKIEILIQNLNFTQKSKFLPKNLKTWLSFCFSLVHNPRKMIEVITKTEETGLSEERAESELAKMANRKKLFKEIESAYTVLLDLELMVQDELRSFGKEAKKVEELRNLIRPDDQLRLLSLLSIRKGKRLIQRILPHLSTEDSAKILTCFINNLALLIKVVAVAM